MDQPLAPARPHGAIVRVRYSGTAQVLHWLTAVLMFTILPLAWGMTAVAKDNPWRDTLFLLHKSVGVTILALTIIRLAWRGTHPAPALPQSLMPWQAFVAKLSHWLLYLILIIMPVSGYVMSSTGGHSVSFFGLFDFPALPQDKPISKLADAIHLTTQWAVYTLIALHLLATTWHVAVRRDGILERMLPEQRNVE